MNTLKTTSIGQTCTASRANLMLIAPAICAFALITFATAPLGRAVVPPPAGGYPGFNTAEGTNALKSLTTGVANTAVGWYSLFSNTDGSYNTAFGAGALLFNLGEQGQGNAEGTQNTAVGAGALLFNATGYANSAVGVAALNSNTSGVDNTANGVNALQSNTTGNQNVAVGTGALANLTGNNNIAVGYLAGSIPNMGDNNIYIGNGGVSVMGFEENTIRIGAAQQATYVAGISGTNVMGAPVVVAADGRLGVTMSSERFKTNIQPMHNASDTILELKPVTFRYKADKTDTPQFGLIAEEVAKVNPALVLTSKEGKPYAVRYEAVNAMLLNEFLKEHRRVKDLESKVASQEAIIAQQQKGMESLVTQLKQQDSKIDEVSNQLKLLGPASFAVATHHY